MGGPMMRPGDDRPAPSKASPPWTAPCEGCRELKLASQLRSVGQPGKLRVLCEKCAAESKGGET